MPPLRAQAAETGGEFLIADGRKIFSDIDSDVMSRLYSRSIRYSVMELPFFGWVDSLPEFVQGGVMGALKGLASAGENWRSREEDEMRRGRVSNSLLLVTNSQLSMPRLTSVSSSSSRGEGTMTPDSFRLGRPPSPLSSATP